ncbi:hypothetical protein CDD81_7727 [Ophiocordyceps australis]|uniref:Uncharacterized protein n=1 Tax=Ophiocordyceps australis TaxID=1399860 RepID=A0A2C5Y3W4_9HYPO|nr:hypothetical protein CDD81_7727 [Ophiocordyceps australis]
MKIQIALLSLLSLSTCHSLSPRAIYKERPPGQQIGDAVRDGLGTLQGNIPYTPGTHAKPPSKNQIGGMPYLNRARPRPKNEGKPGTPGNPLGPRKKPGRIYTRCEANAASCIAGNTRRLSKLANGIGEAEFKRLTNIYGMEVPDKPNKAAKGGLKLSLTEIRAGFRGFRVPGSKGTGKKWLSNLVKSGVKGSSVTLAASIPLYITDVAEVMNSDASGLEKAAVATSIVPFVGCTVRKLANDEKDTQKTLSTALCYAGDFFLASGLWPLKLVADVLSSAFDFDENMDAEYVKKQRRDGWVKRYKELVKYLSSDGYRQELIQRYSLEVLAPIYVLSETSAMLYVGDIVADESSDEPSNPEAQSAEKQIEDSWIAAQQQVCAQMIDTERRFDVDVPAQTAQWLEDEYKEYNRRYRMSYMRNRQIAWAKLESYMRSRPVTWGPSEADIKARFDDFWDQALAVYQALQQEKRTDFYKKDVEGFARDANKQIPRDHGVCNGPPLKMGAPVPGEAQAGGEEELGYEKLIDKIMAEETPRIQIFTDAFYKGSMDEVAAPLGECVDLRRDFNDNVSSFSIKKASSNIKCTFYRDFACVDDIYETHDDSNENLTVSAGLNDAISSLKCEEEDPAA